jgi:hypothetical protein
MIHLIRSTLPLTRHTVPLGPNTRAARARATRLFVAAPLRRVTRDAEPVGGLGGAAPAPPKAD